MGPLTFLIVALRNETNAHPSKFAQFGYYYEEKRGHAGYRISQEKRKRIEECFGCLKTIALLRKVRHRGLFKVDWVFTFACAAYNLVRLRNLSMQAA